MSHPALSARVEANVGRMRRGIVEWLGISALGLAALVTTQAMANETEMVIESHGYSFFGDLKYPKDFERLDYVNPDAPKGGEISQWAEGTFDSFNLYTRKGRQGALTTIGHESILTTVADDVTASYCLLCTTMEYPESKDWVIFNLREDVTFHDGSPLVASDIVFTFNEFMEKGLPSFRAAFGAQISNVEALGDHTIRFDFMPEAPRRDVIELAGGIPAFSEAWFKENVFQLDESSLTPIMGTGPYMLDSYDVNRRIVYRRVPDYWGADLPINVGRFNFDRIRVEYFGDGIAALEAFKAGEYTFRSENSSKSWAVDYDFPGIQNGYIKKVELPDGNLAYAQSFVFNLRREKFQDPRVREAIGLMFNFEWSNETLFYGLYDRVNSFWGNSDLEATGVPEGAERELLQALVDEGKLDESILTDVARMAPGSGPRQLDRRNLRRASALLDEAGWIVGDDGVRRKDGQVLTVELLNFSPAFDRILNPFVQNLQTLGIQAKLDRVDPSQGTDRERNYDFDLTTHGFNMPFEPSTGLKQWFGSEAMEESTRNLMGYSSEAVDLLIEAIIAATTRDEMKTAIRALDRVLRAANFWVPQWYKSVHTVAYYDQYSYPEPLPPLALGVLDFWWYDEDAAARLREAGAL